MLCSVASCPHLLFVNDVILLASSSNDVHLGQEWFGVAECAVAAIRIRFQVWNCGFQPECISASRGGFWVLTERIRLHIQAVEMSFLWRESELSLTDRISSESIHWSSERSRLAWFGYLTRTRPITRSLRQIQLGGDPEADPGHMGKWCPSVYFGAPGKIWGEEGLGIYERLLPQWHGAW